MSRCWDLIGGEGTEDFFAFQEVGGLKELAPKGWDQHEMYLGASAYATFSAFPTKSFHGTVVGIPLDALPQVIRVTPLLTGLAVEVRNSECIANARTARRYGTNGW